MPIKGNQWSITKRPQTLNEVYGCEVIKTYFTNIKKVNKPIPNAIWLQGLFGSGKTTTAKIIAKMIQCNNPKEDGSPCNCCDSCVSIETENFGRDTIMFNGGPDGTIDKIRGLLTELELPPIMDRNKVVIVEEAQEISNDGMNALLKAIESPEDNIYFIFTSMADKTSPKLKAVKSRCREFTFKPAKVMDIMYYLKTILESENLWMSESIPKDFFTYGLQAIATNCYGSYRQALQMLEQCIDAQLFTVEAIRENMGITDIVSFYTVLLEMLEGRNSQMVMDTLLEGDFQEQFNLAYKTLSDASVLRTFGKLPENMEYFLKQASPIASHKNFDIVLDGFNKIAEQSSAYMKRATYVIGICDIINKCKQAKSASNASASASMSSVPVQTPVSAPAQQVTISRKIETAPANTTATASAPAIPVITINTSPVSDAKTVEPNKVESTAVNSTNIESVATRSIRRVAPTTETPAVPETPVSQPTGRIINRTASPAVNTGNTPRVVRR